MLRQMLESFLRPADASPAKVPPTAAPAGTAPAQEVDHDARLIGQLRLHEGKRHAALCVGLNRPPRAPLPKVRSATASRASVRAWMRAAADDYDTATELAEGANAALELPAGAMDDESHWIWEEAIKAIPAD